MKKFYFVFCVLLLNICLYSTAQEQTDQDKKTDWWGDIDGFLNQQAKITLGMADDLLKLNVPAGVEPLERKMALLMIDNVLHDEKAAYRPAVQTFLQKRIENAVDEIRSSEVKQGAVVWKLYNHAFVVKTPSVTIGFDIQRGITRIEGFSLKKDLIQQLIDVVDVLFISHFHGDHTDEWVAERFIAQNKPVVSTPDLWINLPIYQQILHPERKANMIQEISLPLKGFRLKVINYPGHQGETILNNVYLVFSPEGISFAHTGDQSNLKDFEWIDTVGDNQHVDVVMANSWSVYPEQRIAKGFRPGLIIPGHENEMAHTIDHREPYWLNYQRLGDPKIFPWVQLAWGEKFNYMQNP